MSSIDEPRAPVRAQAARGRVARDVETGERRRRRDPNDNGTVMRLSIPESTRRQLSQTHHLRWVVEQPGRTDQLYRQDWDFVTDEELGGADQPATRHADLAQNRLPLNMRLMKKPRDYYEADHAANLKRLDDEMKAAELGQKVLNGPNGAGEGLDAQDERVYAPPSPNKL